MSNKNVDDYLTEGIYGKRRPKEAERQQFLGTLRERIVLALTKGQVMSDKGLAKLEEAMKEHKDAKLIMNGHVSYRFLKEEKALADKYNIPYTTITNEETDTDIGAVLTYDHAIDKENIFIEKENTSEEKEETNKSNESFFSKLKKFF
ncbi:YueI family protein [Virgibacillus sp. C22-A2]|uniref:YueI family protein n=1 Tax=Virgibacillus tibetensis TaxID=3042313 RepID=A0ABU6KJB8_9BACI|nr:YueI family protein [Virgibacillus sp. C22-A2]